MGALDFLFGSKDKVKSSLPKSLQQYIEMMFQNNPGSLEDNSLYQQGSSHLSDILSNKPGAFDAYAAPHLRQFNEEIIPQLSEVFGGLGTGAGGTLSSAFANSATQAGASLAERLAAQRAGLQENATSQALGYAQQPQANRLAYGGLSAGGQYIQGGKSGLIPSAISGIAGGLSSGFGLNAANSGIQGISGFFNRQGIQNGGGRAGPQIGLDRGVGAY